MMLDAIILTMYLKKHYKGSIITSIIGIVIITNLKLDIIPIIIKYMIYFYSYKTYESTQKYQVIQSFSTRFFYAVTIILTTIKNKC